MNSFVHLPHRLLMMAFLAFFAVFALAAPAFAQDPTSTPEATETPTPEPTASPTPEEIEQERCLDFESQQDAQTFYETEGVPEEDRQSIDADADGVACEGLIQTSVMSSQGEGAQDTATCADFSTQEEAQAFYEDRIASGGSTQGLDDDGDGVACENLTAGGGAESSAQTGTPNPAASPTSTPATSSPTTTPFRSTLPRSGAPIKPIGIAGGILTLLGIVMTLVSQKQQRQLELLPSMPHLWDDYSLKGW